MENEQKHANFSQVSDDEWERLKRGEEIGMRSSYTKNSHSPIRQNALATVLKTISIGIFIVGFLIGVIAWIVIKRPGFLIALGIWISAFISGVVILVFEEILRLLQEIKNELSSK